MLHKVMQRQKRQNTNPSPDRNSAGLSKNGSLTQPQPWQLQILLLETFLNLTFHLEKSPKQLHLNASDLLEKVKIMLKI